ncbi:MAG: hypothetical protein HZA54_00620 [Planctomycetes bacterium]|nr:hypothetical protein [Planctomycetota bacterium]
MGLAQELETKLGVKPEIHASWPGSLDVLVDGKTVFSKRAAGRAPNPGEVAALIAGAQPAAQRTN